MTEVILNDEMISDVLNKINPNDIMEMIKIKEGYHTMPPTIQEFLYGNEYLGSSLGDQNLFPHWEKVLKEVFPNPFYSPYLEIVLTGCLTGDTKVRLSNGESKSLLDIVEDFKLGKEIYVRGYNKDTDEFIDVKILNAAKTYEKRKIVKITLDDGSEIKSTLNHKFYDKSRNLVEVYNLKEGDEILST